MIVSESLLRDIESRKRKMDEQIEKTSLLEHLLNCFKKSIDEEANVHSCRMEFNYRNNNETNNPEVRREINLCYKNLENAWEWGIKNFKFNFDEDFIVEIAKRVEPDVIDGYRRPKKGFMGGVRADPHFTPPYPSKIGIDMGRLMKNLAYGREQWKMGKASMIEIAIMAHYHLLRIHPFEDGNGRTSRLIQNLIINQFGYPASMIQKGEKAHYIKHLSECHQGFRFREHKENNKAENLIDKIAEDDYWTNLSKGEKDLYDYLASRINTSIDLILDKAYKK